MKTLVLSRVETEAVLHVRDIQATGHQHSTSGCPPFTRQRCRHRVALSAALSKHERSERLLDADGRQVFRSTTGLWHVSEERAS